MIMACSDWAFVTAPSTAGAEKLIEPARPSRQPAASPCRAEAAIFFVAAVGVSSCSAERPLPMGPMTASYLRALLPQTCRVGLTCERLESI